MSHFPRARALVCAAVLALGFGGLAAAASPAQTSVDVVPIKGTLDRGTAALLERALAHAAVQHGAIVLDIDSTQSVNAAALQMRAALMATKVPVYAYVAGPAYAGAALVALAAQQIVVAPNASIGNAAPIPATQQSVAAMRALFDATAVSHHRNPTLASAMVDASVKAPPYTRPDSTLTLNAAAAVSTHMADGTANSLDAMLAQDHLSGAPVQTARYSLFEQIARIAAIPLVSTLLLTLGMLGLLVEMQTLHGVAGVIGLAALTLFFGTHIYDGFAGSIVAIVAIAGLLGILWELHVVPGHGAPGVLGSIALICAALWAFGLPLLFVGIETISTSIVLTVILFAVATRFFPENAWMNKLMLRAEQGPEYVTSADFSALLGAFGTAATYLRPSGLANIDGERIDVLTEGEFIAQGTPIRVTRVEGARIFVEPVNLPSYQ